MKRSTKRTDIATLLVGVVAIILLNVLGSFMYKRIDLTAEKRYTLTPATIDLVKNLDDVLTIKVYLTGDLPAYYLKLRDATRDLLQEMRAINKNVEFEFIDPSESTDKKTREDFYRQLAKRGIKYTQHDTKKEIYVFPGAIVSYGDKEIPLQLMQFQNALSKEVMCYNSINNLEYEFSNAVRKFDIRQKPKIAFIEGHGELDTLETRDITNALSEYYDIERVTIGNRINALVDRGDDTVNVKLTPRYKAIIIAKPDTAFTEKELFTIDQYLMYGGKALWAVDPVFVNMDSLQTAPVTMAFPQNLGLDQLFFTYGIRLEPNLLMDLIAAPIPVITEVVDGKPKQELFPWYYYPVCTPTSKHPIVKSINDVRLQFTSSIDTVGNNPDVKRYVLLHTSRYSKYQNTPARISLNILGQQPNEKQYNLRYIPTAILAEGFFESMFKGSRLVDALEKSPVIAFKPKSDYTKQVFIADGDVLRNDIQKSTGKAYPLDMDKFTGMQFGNKTLVMNAVNYLCDDNGLITARARDIKVRLLDTKRITKSKLNIQLTNVGLPIIVGLVIALMGGALRRRRYAKRT